MLAADLVSLSPADDATAVDVGSNLVLTFSENVRPGPGTGNILIKNGDDDSLIEGTNVNSDQVTFDGATVTIDPTADLSSFKNYYVEVDPSAIRDMSSDVTTGAVLLSEDFERLRMLDSGLAVDSEFDPNADLNNYIVTFTGTMVVEEAGEYTFGVNSDDGNWLLIDFDQDSGGDLEELRTDFDDEIIIDNTTHGNQNRLSTCGALDAVQSCVGSGSRTFDLEAGEYLFEAGYFEAGGGSSGEFFYAKGTLEAFDANAFVLMGDPSQGISISEDGMTATTYKSATAIGTVLYDAWDLRDGFIGLDPNFPVDDPGNPVAVTMELADVWNTGGIGNFAVNNPVPGTLTLPSEGTDYSPAPPFGWTNDTADTPAIVAPEFDGWVPLDKKFWINQQGNQDRTDFALGENVVAVVDPDAYDDFTDIDPDGGLLNAFFTTAEIDLTDVAANSVNLSFVSSFRAEPTQIAELRVSYDGGANYETILQYDGAVEADKDHINEELSFDLDNPSGGSLLVQFAMLQGSNDWWWAIDNVVVTGDVTGGTFAGIHDRETWSFDTFTSPIVAFDETSVIARETDGTIVLTLHRAGGDNSVPLTVDYATANGSAKAGEDFEAASGTIEFAADETQASVSINLLDDDVEERSESFTIVLSNASGGTLAGDPLTVNLRASDGDVLTFQEGVEVTLNGAGAGTTYSGTTDADPRGASADETRDRAELNPDGEDGGQQIHALTKFADIFGEAAWQVPTNLPDGVEIASATLTLNVTNEGTPIRVHRMLGAWDEATVTWNNLMLNGNTQPGLQGDGVEALPASGEFSAMPAGVKVVDVTVDLIAWLNGEENNGWGFTPTGTNGVDWDSSEAADPAVRPLLTIEFVDVPDKPELDGDVDGNGVVDLVDFNILKENFGLTPATRGQGDLDGNGTVDLLDFNELKANFGNSAAAIAFAALADGDGDDDAL